MTTELRIDIHIHPDRIVSDPRWTREKKIEIMLSNQIKEHLISADYTSGFKRIELFDWDQDNNPITVGELLINPAC